MKPDAMTRRVIRQHKAAERGWVFLAAVITLTVLLFLGASLIERAQQAVYRTAIDNRSARAFQLAEAGLHQSLWALNQPNGWLTYTGQTKTALAGGFVEVTIAPPPAERGVLTDRLRLVARGYLPGANGTARVPRRIHAIVGKDPRYFSYAVFGTEQVTIGNGTVTVLADSYTSDDGAYGGGNVTANADIGTNSTAANAVQILPLGEVHGKVTVGPGAPAPELCVDNKGTITGEIVSAEAANLLPNITSVPSEAIELGDVWLDGSDELVLNAGSYHVTDLDMFGASQITCNGEVVIYIDQTTDAGSPDVRIGGRGIANTSQIPSNLILYCLDDVTTISISGSAAFYGGIYAPNAAITLNSGEVYGSLVGRRVTMNGATSHVHYDEALRDHANPHALVRAWHGM